jgi:hypothetical protein
MAHQILLYVSAGFDLAAEREVLGRAITEIPVDLGWRIFQTPGSGRRVDREAVELADIHLFLLGGDVKAPTGYEWMIARQAGRWPIPLLKTGVNRTPSAFDMERFIRYQARWFPYYRPADLRRRALRLLSAFILFKADELQLSLVEIQTLLGWRRELDVRPVDEETIAGAGEGGILISRDRLVPQGGVLVRPQEETDEQKERDRFWPDIDLDWLDLDEQADDQNERGDDEDDYPPFPATSSLN